jgi:hypothetical protein
MRVHLFRSRNCEPRLRRRRRCAGVTRGGAEPAAGPDFPKAMKGEPFEDAKTHHTPFSSAITADRTTGRELLRRFPFIAGEGRGSAEPGAGAFPEGNKSEPFAARKNLITRPSVQQSPQTAPPVGNCCVGSHLSRARDEAARSRVRRRP